MKKLGLIPGIPSACLSVLRLMPFKTKPDIDPYQG